MDDIDYKRLLNEFGMMLLAFVVSMAICGVIGMLTSCRSVKYVPVPEYHTEYKVKTDSFVKRDSVWVKDSVRGCRATRYTRNVGTRSITTDTCTATRRTR